MNNGGNGVHREFEFLMPNMAVRRALLVNSRPSSRSRR